MPEGSSTYNFGINGGGNSKGEFSFAVNTGYSSSIKENCVEVSTSKYDVSSKTFMVVYKYNHDTWTPSSVFNGIAARINKWLTNSRQCFYAFSYKIPRANTYQEGFSFDCEVVFSYRQQYGSTYYGDGSDGKVTRKFTYSVNTRSRD